MRDTLSYMYMHDESLKNNSAPVSVPGTNAHHYRALKLVAALLAVVVLLGVVYQIIAYGKTKQAREQALRNQYEAGQVSVANQFFVDHAEPTPMTDATKKTTAEFFKKNTSPEPTVDQLKQMQAAMVQAETETYAAWKAAQKK